MDKLAKNIVIILYVVACLLFGYLIGDSLRETSSEKEILNLSIELKKLEIKKLKESNNE
jgi:hypothetical protein